MPFLKKFQNVEIKKEIQNESESIPRYLLEKCGQKIISRIRLVLVILRLGAVMMFVKVNFTSEQIPPPSI